uniref:Uncharacterized protein n=1 Tax=Florenciella sp. virus SA2 TaxID=3240092 RepID=A0AB39JA71_9VIRU
MEHHCKAYLNIMIICSVLIIFLIFMAFITGNGNSILKIFN